MGGLRKLHIEKLQCRRNELQLAGYEFLVAMLMEVKGFWAMTPCRLACSTDCRKSLTTPPTFSLLFVHLFDPEKGSNKFSETSTTAGHRATGNWNVQAAILYSQCDSSGLFGPFCFTLYSPVVTICTAS